MFSTVVCKIYFAFMVVAYNEAVESKRGFRGMAVDGKENKNY